MAIQAQDLPYNSDIRALLGRMSSPQAGLFARNLRDLAFEPPAGPIRGKNPPKHDMIDFVAELDTLRTQATRDLREDLSKTSLLDCLTVGILLGQKDKTFGKVTGSPNAFTYEMEFLASLATRIEHGGGTTRRRMESAFNALRLARQHRIASEWAAAGRRIADGDGTMASLRKDALRTQLTTEWTSVRGGFDTRYDWAYSRRLADRLTSRGVHHPPVEAIPALLVNVITRWSGVIDECVRTLEEMDGQLGLTARRHTLLDTPGRARFTRRDGALLAKVSRQLVITPAVLMNGPSALDAGALDEWMGLLTLAPASIGRNVAADSVFDSPLANAPVIATRHGYLIALFHLFSTELSRLLERIFARTPGLQYYRARGEVLEEAAVEVLGAVFPDATVVHGGQYRGSRPGELIEVDGLLLWHDIAIVVEGKGGYLSARSRRGDEAAAIGDYRDTIGDGFFQAARLIRTLEDDRSVDLLDGSGRVVTLDRSRIRRAYVVIPTADVLGGITTSLQLFWHTGVLPPTSLPLIVPIQQLHLMTDLLNTPLEFVAYLDYREQILANPAIHIADEGELLGNFVGGKDVLLEIHAKVSRFSFEQSLPEWGNRQAAYLIGTDAQQTYLNKWIAFSGQAELTGRDPKGLVAPRRHDAAHRAEVDEYFAARGNLPAASILMQLPELPWREQKPPRPRRGSPALLPVADTTFVGFAVGDSVARVRRLPDVARLRAEMRHVVYLQVKDGQFRFRHAEAGRAHPFFNDANKPLTQRSRLGDLSTWFDDFRRRRHGGRHALTDVQAEERDRLIRSGLTPPLSTGIARLGLVNKVLDLVDDDISLTQAADTYLTHIRSMADEAGVAVTDLSLTPDTIKGVLMLARNHRIDRDAIPELLRLALHDPSSSPESLAHRSGLFATADDATVKASIEPALNSLGVTADELARLPPEQRKKIRNQLLGQLRGSLPSPNMANVARILDAYLAEADGTQE